MNRLPLHAAQAAGIASLVSLWQIAGTSRSSGSALAPPSATIAFLIDPEHRGLLIRATETTLASAGWGFLAGTTLGIALAALGRVVPLLATGNDRANAALHAIPVVALGPFLVIFLGVDAAPVAMATLSVLFSAYAAATSGLAAVAPAHRDLMQILGASGGVQLRRVGLPSAAPMLATGIRLSVPRAFLGAIVGEWFGASRGLGVLVATGMQEARIPLLWTAVTLVTLLSGIAYALGDLMERGVRARLL